jgi:HD superfamily phosphohydrolase
MRHIIFQLSSTAGGLRVTKKSSEPQLSENSVREKIDAYVSKQLKEYRHIKITNAKVIHDSVHGTHIFYPYEIAFLDMPVIQRLRRISQTDVASFVFPAGNHNRFEHTVGVTAIAGQMVDSIFPKCNDLLPDINRDFIFHNCRVAAILHDCGHGPFSHLSEQLYAPQFNEIKAGNPILRGASAHEIQSYFIATSTPMREFNEKVIKDIYGIDIDLDFVGEMIVGYIDKNELKKKSHGFAVELINGAFDADKLDYILRDAHATGIRMALDLPRLLYTLNIISDDDGVNRLAIDISGVTALEEIVFNKMMLACTIYHHQKVRAAGCMLKGIIESSEKFRNALDYLDYTDDQILNLTLEKPSAKMQLRMLKNRILPKRAFCFSSRTLKDISIQRKIMSQFEKKEFKKDVIANIASYVRKNLNRKIHNYEIWIDSPKNPKFKEATQCLIKSEGSENNHLLLRDVFPTDDWVRAFSENKWQGFVYAMPDKCHDVAIASKYVLEEVFQTEFNSFATKLCKIDDSDIVMKE